MTAKEEQSLPMTSPSTKSVRESTQIFVEEDEDEDEEMEDEREQRRKNREKKH